MTEAVALAADLAGEPIVRAVRASGGRNSRVYQVVTVSGRAFALKLYAQDQRDRLEREFETLEFLAEAGIARVPTAIAQDRRRGAALYSWIEGQLVGAHRVSGDVLALSTFLREVHDARMLAQAARLRPAAEAITSGDAIEKQLAVRLDRLIPAAASRPALARVLGDVKDEIRRRGSAVQPELARELQTLSPSDIGFHNALRRPDGSLAFVDFEYFGWDDPVKVTCDVLWHPGHALDARECEEFASAAAAIYGNDRDFERRFTAFYPLLGLRWALIVLNEFVPDEQTRRKFARGGDDDGEIEQRQLAKARDLLARVRALSPRTAP